MHEFAYNHKNNLSQKSDEEYLAEAIEAINIASAIESVAKAES